MIKKSVFAFLLFSLFLVQDAFAIEYRPVEKEATYNPSQWKKESHYIDRAFGKLTYGTWNFMLGWMELAREPYEASVLGDNLLLGFAKGIAYSVADMGGGLLNTLTFPVTVLTIPLPEGGVESREF